MRFAFCNQRVLGQDERRAAADADPGGDEGKPGARLFRGQICRKERCRTGKSRAAAMVFSKIALILRN